MPKQSVTPAVAPYLAKKRVRPLGPFTYLLLCTINKLPRELRYGAILEKDLSEQYGGMIDLAQIYVGLQRLVEKKFITEGKEQQAPTGTKHTVIVYDITKAGREALTYAANFYKMLAKAAPN